MMALSRFELDSDLDRFDKLGPLTKAVIRGYDVDNPFDMDVGERVRDFMADYRNTQKPDSEGIYPRLPSALELDAALAEHLRKWINSRKENR